MTRSKNTRCLVTILRKTGRRVTDSKESNDTYVCSTGNMMGKSNNGQQAIHNARRRRIRPSQPTRHDEWLLGVFVLSYAFPNLPSVLKASRSSHSQCLPHTERRREW